MLRSLFAAPLLLPLASRIEAQTGPFQDGELLVRVIDVVGLEDTLFRIDPVTGNGAVLFQGMYAGYSGAGWMAYDSYRDGVLAYAAYQPEWTFQPRLLLLRADGSFTDLGFREQDITALAPVGDGRVYLRKGGVLHVLSAANVLTPVLDHLGDPIDLNVDHLIHDPGTDSLVGVSHNGANGVPCAGFNLAGVAKLPLSANGLQLSGPIVCTSLAVRSTAPIGLDPLPGGEILLTFADQGQFSTNDLFRIDPATMAISVWASTDHFDLNGGVWCDPLGGAVLHEDWNNELRVHAQGSMGTGALLPVSVPVGGGQTGTSSTNWMADVDFQGPACGGFVQGYGAGLAGKGGRIPLLGAATCPALGTVLPMTVSNGVGAALVVFGASSASIPVLGGTLLVQPPFFAVRAVTLGGSIGIAGDGFGQVNLSLPNDPMLAGVPFFVQAAVSDAAAPKGWAMTAGVELRAQ